MVSLELLNGVRSGNRFEKRIVTGKWKRPQIAIKNREGSADHTISSLISFLYNDIIVIGIFPTNIHVSLSKFPLSASALKWNTGGYRVKLWL